MPLVMREIMNNDLTIPLHSDGHAYVARDKPTAEREQLCDVSYERGVKLRPFSPSQQVHHVVGEEVMRESLFLYGPIQVAIDASPLPMYHDYIIQGDECKWNQLNHAVVLTAYSESFYTIKNSWGTGWGDRGYFKIEAKLQRFRRLYRDRTLGECLHRRPRRFRRSCRSCRLRGSME